jgi:uncharacterized protein (DUF1810 family)
VVKEKPMINRFREPQKNYFEQACRELQNGRKTSHWIWYIFPQLKGLGYSYNSNFYGLSGIAEAKEYLADKELRDHLTKVCQILIDLNAPDIEKVMGYIDAIKLKSSMTLFYLASSDAIFKQVLDMYFGGQMCQKTVEQVGNAWDNLANIKTAITLEEIDAWKKDGQK